MTEYLKDSFSVNLGQNKNYRDNWDEIFGKLKHRLQVTDTNGHVWYVHRDDDGLEFVDGKLNASRFEEKEAEAFAQVVKEKNPGFEVVVEKI